jgi:alpha-L-rhamnosidase
MRKTPVLTSLLLAVLGFSLPLPAAEEARIAPQLLREPWPAPWISIPGRDRKSYGVFRFRREFELKEKPSAFVIHVTADSRYRLYVNGRAASEGPSRGDLEHWRFETLDIAALLKPGRNVLAAEVWNMGEHSPVAQMTSETGFLLQGDSDLEAVANTGESWKVIEDRAFSPLPRNWSGDIQAPALERQFKGVGPGDRVDGALYLWGWQEPGYDDSRWLAPLQIGRRATPRGIRDGGSFWNLVPRTIPQMEQKEQELAQVRRASGVSSDGSFLRGAKPIVIPAGTRATVLFDQGCLTTAYPGITLSGGRGSTLTLVYAEALLDSLGQKSNRDRVEGMHIFGTYDQFLPDGGAHRTFSTLWIRAFRYLELEVVTGTEPLTIHSLNSRFTAYPFEEKAAFSADDTTLAGIWRVAWRTARLCAGETYFDCPYYEQLQYVGDTRIQALISLYVSGDDRLMRQAIMQFDDSRIPDGLTASRYPSNISQVIPPYSLFWVVMLHDYWRYRTDERFVASYLPGVRGVLEWFESRLDERGLLARLPWWNFVDWVPEYPEGVPPGAEDGESTVISFQYLYALRCAREMASAFGRQCEADQYARAAERVARGLKQYCWSEERGLFAETPEKKQFSQHANAMALLVDLVPKAEEGRVMDRVLGEKDLIQCTFYYQFYLLEALKKTGRGDEYLDHLKPWYDMLDLGLTTFAEKPEPTRSDCHAWSACPLYGLLATVCGIEPASTGFRTVRIAPHPGRLKQISARMPHPQGLIVCKLQRQGANGIRGEIVLPGSLSGSFIWHGQEVALHPGSQTVDLP